jgi:hypothetical protein
MDEVFQQEQDEQAQEEQELAEYRYRLLLEAFTELLEKQVSNQTLETLRYEAGLPEQDFNQLKGKK